MKKVIAAVAVVSALTLSGCASMQGKGTDGSKQEWEDSYGRVCTAIKWGDSASVDCDYPEK